MLLVDTRVLLSPPKAPRRNFRLFLSLQLCNNTKLAWIQSFSRLERWLSTRKIKTSNRNAERILWTVHVPSVSMALSICKNNSKMMSLAFYKRRWISCSQITRGPWWESLIFLLLFPRWNCYTYLPALATSSCRTGFALPAISHNPGHSKAARAEKDICCSSSFRQILIFFLKKTTSNFLLADVLE